MSLVLGISRSIEISEIKPKSSAMKSIIFALALVAITAALPVDNEPVKILRSELVQQPEGSYTLRFESEDGIVREETGEVKEVVDEENKPHAVVVVRGFYTYTDSNGKVETVNYEADEAGYRAFGDSIPKLAEAVLAR